MVQSGGSGTKEPDGLWKSPWDLLRHPARGAPLGHTQKEREGGGGRRKWEVLKGPFLAAIRCGHLGPYAHDAYRRHIQ